MLLWVCFLEVINFLVLVNLSEPQEFIEDRLRGSSLFLVCTVSKSASSIWEKPVTELALRIPFRYCCCLQNNRMSELFLFCCC